MADISQMSLPDGNTYDIVDSKSRWEGTQAQYDALSSHDPNVIYYITDGVSANVSVINDLSDVAILSPQNGQTLTYNSTSQMWTNTDVSTSYTITVGSSMPSGFPLPTVVRRGNVVQVIFGIQLPARTYTNTDIMWNISPKPLTTSRASIALGSTFPTINISANGEIKFNGTQTLSGITWFIGQIMYLTDG